MNSLPHTTSNYDNWPDDWRRQRDPQHPTYVEIGIVADKRQQIFNLGRGRNTQTYVPPRGKELIGKTIWLRAEEIGGDRILNHRIVVEP